jgi:hypothetical protein
MAREIPTSTAQFSFDQLVSEVDAIVEDLRWLHLELSLRNHCTELLFQETVTAEELLRHTFSGLRERLGVIELAVLMKGRYAFRVAFREQDPLAEWLRDRTPWTDTLDRWLGLQSRDLQAPQATVNHYKVDAQSVTAITMPILLQREYVAVLLLVAPSSNIVPRLKRLVNGLSGTLGLALGTLRSRGDRAANGVPEETGGELPVSDARFPVRVIRSFYAMLLDAQGTVIDINDCLADDAGITAEWVRGKSVYDTLLSPDDGDTARRAFSEALGAGEGKTEALSLGIAARPGAVLPTLWYMTPLGGHAEHATMLGCFGTPLRTAGDVALLPLPPQDTVFPLEAKLAKQYRFMLKYVPFPVLHLEEQRDVIRNANPAFEALVGSRQWEGMPLGDFGALHIHGTSGDPRPCTLQVISPNGITISYRGIITSLMIFGKTIREVKLDPLE